MMKQKQTLINTSTGLHIVFHTSTTLAALSLAYEARTQTRAVDTTLTQTRTQR